MTPTHTPPEVIDAIAQLSAYLRSTGYEQILVSVGGGASFHRDNLLDRVVELEMLVAAMQQDAIAVG